MVTVLGRSPDADVRRRAIERYKLVLELAASYRVDASIGRFRGWARWAPDRVTAEGWFRAALDELVGRSVDGQGERHGGLRVSRTAGLHPAVPTGPPRQDPAVRDVDFIRRELMTERVGADVEVPSIFGVVVINRKVCVTPGEEANLSMHIQQIGQKKGRSNKQVAVFHFHWN